MVEGWTGVAQLPQTSNLNPQDKKVVFLVGNNAAAHSVLNIVLQELASMGIHADVYLTPLPKNPALQRKIDLPENRNFKFYERLPIDVIYPIIEARPILLRGDDLDEHIKYSPRQLAEFYKTRGIRIQVETLEDVNDPKFVDKICADPNIVMGYNVRGMQILKAPIIQAFQEKEYKLSANTPVIRGYIANAHPGPLPSIPGTHTVFWARMLGLTRNEWTLHVIDEGIDTGPTLDTCTKAFGRHKTLLQSMIGMDREAAQMIVSNTRLFFEGRPRQPLAQRSEGRPEKNYSYPTHEQWEIAKQQGIVAVNPQNYALALAREYTGGTENAPNLYQEICLACLDSINRWQREYEVLQLQHYGEIYNSIPQRRLEVHSW
jgi:hypothetical protein